jgi:tetratricopeptide (TPR) repeat protein
MRTSSLKVLTALVLAVLLVTGCGLSKMIKKYPTVKFSATPEVLETHGGKITVTFNGTVPAKYFIKKAAMFFEPVLVYDGGETVMKPIMLKGEKVQGDGQVVKKKEGGSFTYTYTFDYKPEMNKSVLKVNPIAFKAKESVKETAKKIEIKEKFKGVELGERKLADGVIYTSERVERDEDIEIAANGYELETIFTKSGNLYFDYNKSNFDKGLALNKDTANIGTLKLFYAFLKQNWKIKSFDVNAWCSPEGELTLNQKLADERGKTANKYLLDEFKKMIKDSTLKGYKKPEDVKLNIVSKGPDYDGFMKTLNGSNLPQKQTIGNVINSHQTRLEREKAIRDMTVIYGEIEKMLAPLRRAEFVLACYEPKKSKEEIIQLSTTAPNKLDNKELLYSATLTEDNNTKYQIYKSAVQIYPQDWRGYNNAGAIAMLLGKTEEASTLLDQANKLKPNNPQIAYNMGVLAFWGKNNDQAQTYFNTAKAGGIDISYNLGLFKIRQGDYNGALSSFGAKKCKYNIALAQLLLAKLDEASKTLGCTKPQTSFVYYLMAVNGARSGNTSMMYDNIKKAIAADPKYRGQAKDDREFLKYFNEASFQDAVK